MGEIGKGLLAIVGAIIGLAILSVILSKNAQTPALLQSGAGALARIISAAVTPVAGAVAHPSLNPLTVPSASSIVSGLPGLLGT
jgi:PRD1 phage membrane DNA delivery